MTCMVISLSTDSDKNNGTRLLGRILKVGVQNFKQGVQGSNVHVLFNPARLHAAVQFHAVDVDDTFKCISAYLSIERKRTTVEI